MDFWPFLDKIKKEIKENIAPIVQNYTIRYRIFIYTAQNKISFLFIF